MRVTTYIYALFDPRCGSVRYIGKSHNPIERYKRHLKNALILKTHRDCWIYQLLSLDLKPELLVLDEVPIDKWQQFERDWISSCLFLGDKLTNLTKGGDGLSGYICTEDHRTKISISGKEAWSDLELRKRHSVILKGVKKPPRTLEHCQKISKSNMGKNTGPFTEEHKNKIRAAIINHWAERRRIAA